MGRPGSSPCKASLRKGKENLQSQLSRRHLGGPHGHRAHRWALFAAGLGSLIWFLIRVLPKPSRAAYPCQRAAAPFASSFVLWLLAVLGARWALVCRRQLARRTRFAAGFACTAMFVLCVAVGLRSLPENRSYAGPSSHDPLGTAKGIHPGRVVWVHAPDATDWAGWNSLQRWWASNCTDLAVVEQMMSKGIRDVAGEPTDAAAWAALFADFNSAQGRGNRGYRGGEKVAIKINLTTSNGGMDCDLATHEKTKNLNRIDASPQMLLALLRQLVHVAGVPQTNISIGDTTALFPGHVFTPLHTEFPDVNYFEVVGGAGREEVTWSQVRCYWSTPNSNGKLADYVPVPFAEAEYIINFALLKGHSAGITVCGKNLYGTLKRCPNGGLYD